MSRSSPGVRRVAAILNFIADHPGQAFALTDLVRALKLSRATCHALLTGLVDVGYLFRTSDKTYVLGPALAAIGRTAASHFSPIQVAQPEMRALADEFDVVCGAYFLEGNTVQLRDRAASISHVGYPIPLGNCHALTATLAPIFHAGSHRDAVQWFTTQHARQAKAAPLAQFEATLAFVAANGFGAVVYRPGYGNYENREAKIPAGDAYDTPVEALAAIAPEKIYPLAAVFAPIVDARGGVGFALGMAGFIGTRSGEQIVATGQRLRAACDRISSFISGDLGRIEAAS